jgi:hypothetical protein
MKLNIKDGGNRQFIIATNNENKICSDVCYPRIKNCIKGYKQSKVEETLLELPLTWKKISNDLDSIKDKIRELEENQEYQEIETFIENNEIKVIGIKNANKKREGLGNSLKYYKTSFIGKNNILNTTDEDKVELAHNAGELLAIAENTLELVKQTKYYQLFEDNLKERYTAVYFREELDQFDKFIEIVEKLNKKITVYVFSWGQDEFIEEFENLKNINIKTIPVPILEIYKNIYNLGN